MPLLNRELHKTVRGPMGCNEDWWRLVFDTEGKRLYVEHEWAYLDVRVRGARPDDGTTEMDIAEFLGRSGQELKRGEDQAQKELVRLLSELTQGRSNA
jgi:hypothetical protein